MDQITEQMTEAQAVAEILDLSDLTVADKPVEIEKISVQTHEETEPAGPAIM